MVNPVISVIIPVRNDAPHLLRCLECLGRSTFQEYEVIVVDDASTDETAKAAQGHGARVIQLPRQSGPAAARNQGAQTALGQYLLFLDADVCAQPDTLAKFATVFAQRPDVAAVFGSYDKEPTSLNVLSQYKNLMHHFVHQEANGQATTFWSGCGAMRREVFLAMGGFDASSYRRPCIEDIELGARLCRAGHQILLDKDIQVTHLKRWTLWGMLKADVRDRALPWTELILREGAVPNDLNLKTSQRLSALLAIGLLASFVVGAIYSQLLLLVPLALALVILMVDAWSLHKRVPTTWRVLVSVASLGAMVAIAFHFQFWALVPLGLLLALILLNWRFYWFLARERKPLFAIFALPIHILYFLYSTASFALGLLVHYWKLATHQAPRARQVAS